MRNVFLLILLTSIIIGCTKGPNTNSNNNNLPLEFTALFNIFEGQGIGAATNINDDIMLFVSSDGNQYAWFEDNEIKKTANINEEGGFFDGLAFSTIGSMIDFEEERLVFFNKVGGTYQWADINPDLVPGGWNDNTLLTFENKTFNLHEWGGLNACPFEEITGMFGFSKEPEGCALMEDDDLYMWMVNDDGDEISRYYKENGNFDIEMDLEEWRSNSVCGGSPTIFPLNGIGAACVYDPDGGIYQELFFDTDGTKMTILTPSTGMYSEIYNLK